MDVTIYHNPKCSKSRQTLQLLKDKGLKPTVIEYLKTPPNTDEIDGFLSKLDMLPRDLMRTHESEYKDNNIGDKSLSHEQLLDAMFKNPKLIERPLVVVKNEGETKVALGRPIEDVEKIIR